MTPMADEFEHLRHTQNTPTQDVADNAEDRAHCLSVSGDQDVSQARALAPGRITDPTGSGDTPISLAPSTSPSDITFATGPPTDNATRQLRLGHYVECNLRLEMHALDRDIAEARARRQPDTERELEVQMSIAVAQLAEEDRRVLEVWGHVDADELAAELENYGLAARLVLLTTCSSEMEAEAAREGPPPTEEQVRAQLQFGVLMMERTVIWVQSHARIPELEDRFPISSNPSQTHDLVLDI